MKKDIKLLNKVSFYFRINVARFFLSLSNVYFSNLGDANEFLTFLLNNLHVALNGTNKTTSSIIYKTFRGRMRVFTRKVLPVDASDEARRTLLETEEFREKVEELPFLKLTMELPAPPLYRDELLQNVIPQVPLGTLLSKFNGTSEKVCKLF